MKYLFTTIVLLFLTLPNNSFGSNITLYDSDGKIIDIIFFESLIKEEIKTIEISIIGKEPVEFVELNNYEDYINPNYTTLTTDVTETNNYVTETNN